MFVDRRKNWMKGKKYLPNPSICSCVLLSTLSSTCDDGDHGKCGRFDDEFQQDGDIRNAGGFSHNLQHHDSHYYKKKRIHRSLVLLLEGFSPAGDNQHVEQLTENHIYQQDEEEEEEE